MLQESLAEAGQLDVDAEWQTEVIRRLKTAEEEQEKQREQLAKLSRKTHAKEEQLVQMMMEVEGRQVRLRFGWSIRCRIIWFHSEKMHHYKSYVRRHMNVGL